MKNTIIVISLLIISGCAVITGSGNYNATVRVVDYPDAEIFINDQPAGTGNATKLVKRNSDIKIEIREEGCPTKIVSYGKTIRVAPVVLNFLWGLFGGLIGIAIDFGTGGAYKPDHKLHPEVTRIATKQFDFDITLDCDTDER